MSDEPKSWDGPDGVIDRAIKEMKKRDHAKRVLERHTPRFVMAQSLSGMTEPLTWHFKKVDEQIAALVRAGYAIERIEDGDE